MRTIAIKDVEPLVAVQLNLFRIGEDARIGARRVEREEDFVALLRGDLLLAVLDGEAIALGPTRDTERLRVKPHSLECIFPKFLIRVGGVYAREGDDLVPVFGVVRLRKVDIKELSELREVPC
jgi:hypothetical protein